MAAGGGPSSVPEGQASGPRRPWWERSPFPAARRLRGWRSPRCPRGGGSRRLRFRGRAGVRAGCSGQLTPASGPPRSHSRGGTHRTRVECARPRLARRCRRAGCGDNRCGGSGVFLGAFSASPARSPHPQPG